jgi:hypothetical protein
MGDFLMVGGFGTSLLILSFPFSSTMVGGSGTTSLTKIVQEVKGISEAGATYSRPVFSIGLF